MHTTDTRRQANIQMECNYDTICLPYHMTVGVSHDCPHLIGSDRILSLMPRNFRQTYSFYIRLGTRLDDDDVDDGEDLAWGRSKTRTFLFS